MGTVFCMQHADQHLPLDVRFNEGLWRSLSFTSSPQICTAWRLAKLNAKTALYMRGRDLIYHLDAAVVYYLYILTHDTNKKIYAKAKKQLLELLKNQSPSFYLVDICCFVLGSDSEFRDLYATNYQVEGMTCSIL